MKEIKIVKEETKTKYTFKECLNCYFGSIIRLRRSSAIHIGVLVSASDDKFAIQHIPYNNTGHYQTVFTATEIAEWSKHPDTDISIYNAKKDIIKRAKLYETVDCNITKSYEFDTSVIKPGMDILVIKDEGEKGYCTSFHVLDVSKDLIKFTTHVKNAFDKTIYKRKLFTSGYYIEATPEQLANENYSYHYEENCADRKAAITFDYKEMFHKLAQGFKVRCVDWNEGFYIYTKTTDIDVGLFTTIIVDEKGEETLLSTLKLWENNDWELFKEATEDAICKNL